MNITSRSVIAEALASAMMNRKSLKAELEAALCSVDRLAVMVEQAETTVERLKQAYGWPREAAEQPVPVY